MVTKHPSADLRAGYRKTLEIALALSLALMIAAFKFFPASKTASAQPEVGDDPPIFALPEPTIHRAVPPPPPLRRIIIESPGDIPPDSIDLHSELIPNNPPPTPVDEQPEFLEIYETPQPVGGYSALRKNLTYPDMARKVGMEGTVVVIAFIDEAGIVRKAEIKEGIGLGCDEAATAAVLKTRFQPATQRGKAVKVRVSIPIKFRLAH
ncbi:MAG: energy transducer TonB [Bacteroidota bacterium]